jgi:pyroglutamyl-peptidase
MSDGPAPVVLVLGFGPFADIADNPAARLARAVDQARAGRARVRGEVMPVSYHRAARFTLERAQAVSPVAVLGVGVARGRARPALELHAFNDVTGLDIDGQCPGRLDLHGPPRIEATADCRSLGRALDVDLSPDPGRYVCNAWLYRACHPASRHRPPAAFLHIPASGFSPERLIAGLAATWGRAPRIPAPEPPP